MKGFMFINNHWSIIIKHLRNIFIFFISLNIISLISFLVVFIQHINYINEQMNNNIIEYDEIDREQLCKISECISVKTLTLNKLYKVNNKHHLILSNQKPKESIQIYNNFYLDSLYPFRVSVYNEMSDSYYELDIKDLISNYLYILGYFIPASLLIFIYPLIRSIKEEKKEAVLALAGYDALLANKTMINITENIHHELNTPLEVIDNKLEKIHRIVKKFIDEDNKCGNDNSLPDGKKLYLNKLKSLENDFTFIKTASEQIYSILEKMKGFKHLRYSNGNKSIRDIVEGGFKIVKMSNTNFEYQIDYNLANYSLAPDTLKNADFLSILINHLKNSLEANASKIYIIINKFDGKNLYIRILDNGAGIPLEAQSKIFNANFSTKIGSSGIRGNGMFLNKHIINNIGGDIKLIQSSNKGTTIELRVPSIARG